MKQELVKDNKPSVESNTGFNCDNWSGNIRELENIIEKVLILSRGSTPEPKKYISVNKINEELAHQKLEEVENLSWNAN